MQEEIKNQYSTTPLNLNLIFVLLSNLLCSFELSHRPTLIEEIFNIPFNQYWRSTRGKVHWSKLVALIWVVWDERNKRTHDTKIERMWKK